MSFYTPANDANQQWAFTETPGLPRVLIIGDSISIGYTLGVRQALSTVANVWRPMNDNGSVVNCGPTINGIQHLDTWLTSVTWDLIHFNFGLHDIAYRHPEATVYGNRDKINGTISTTPEAYAMNINSIGDRLKKTGATLIWATTTVVPPEEAGRYEGDEIKYNQIAEPILKAKGIAINDLHATTKDFGPDMFVAPGDVHFTPEANAMLTEKVAATIKSRL